MDENMNKGGLSIQPRKEPFKGREMTEEELDELSKFFREEFKRFPPFADILDDDAEITDELEFDPDEPFPEEILNYESLENPTEEETAAFDAWWKQKAQEQREAKARREAEQKDD